MTTAASHSSNSIPPSQRRPADPREAERFAEDLLGMFNHAATVLLVSLGHRAGLFDVLEGKRPLTSHEIAEHSGLHERYVREWLSGMTVARILDYDPETARFSLPAAHAASLCRSSQAGNMAVFAQYIPVLGSVEDDVLHCFRHGGGVPYARFARFHEVMAEDSGQSVVSSLFTHILPLVPGIEARLREGIRVLDLGCGRGLALQRLAEAFPRSQFMGYDLSEQAVAFARTEADRRGLRNLRFEVRDLTSFDREATPGAYDFVTTFDAVHDQADPLALLRGIRRTLAPGGVYLMQEIQASGHLHQDLDHALGPLLYTVSCMHCMTVSLAQGGAGLGAMWGRERAHSLLRAAEFGDVQVHRLEHDPQNEYYVIRP